MIHKPKYEILWHFAGCNDEGVALYFDSILFATRTLAEILQDNTSNLHVELNKLVYSKDADNNVQTDKITLYYPKKLHNY